jgi:hypothetical protein
MSNFNRLTEADLKQFQELGFVGPFQLIEPERVDSVTKELSTEKTKFFLLNRVLSRVPVLKEQLSGFRWGKAKWHKGMHVVSPKVYQISSESAIVDRLASIMGENINLWGSLMLTVKPDEKPLWHTDAECREWDLSDGASVWLALSNVDEQSGMRVITRTHNLKMIPEVLKNTGLNLDDDQALLDAARQFEPESECISVHTKPGEFFIFAANLWHTGGTGSKVRNSLLLQYSKPTTTVRKPLTFDPPVVWDSCIVPCVLVKGENVRQESLASTAKVTL